MWHKRKQIRKLKHGVYELLNRRGFRFGLATLGTVLASARVGKVCAVSFEENDWVQRFPSRILVEPRLSLWTPEEIERWTDDLYFYQYRPREGDTILDVGAGTGWETLLFSRGVGKSGRIVSVEAHPRTFRCLSKVCNKNRLENVTLIQAAVWDREQELYLSDSDDHEANTAVANSSGVRVPGTTLQSICRSHGLSRVDFLKMNIEGAERSALAGMGEMMHKVKNLCISCHDFLATADPSTSELRTKADVIRFLKQNGFAVTLRESDRRPNVRDFVYGRKEQA